MKKRFVVLLFILLISLSFLSLAEEPAPLSCTFLLSNNQVKMGEDITALINISGGTPPYSIKVLSHEDAVLNNRQLKWTAGFSSSLLPQRFKVEVKDATGTAWPFVSSPFSVIDDNPLAVSFNEFPNTAQVGEELTVSWNISGGQPPYSLTYVQANLQSGVAQRSELENNKIVFYAERFGYKSYGIENNSVFISVEDAKGRSNNLESKQFKFEDDRPIKWAIGTGEPDPILAGSPVEKSLTISGGKPPYEVVASFLSDSISKSIPLSYSNGQLLGQTTQQHVGKGWYLRATIADQAGRLIYFETDPLFDVVANNPITATLNLSGDTVKPGGTLTATWQISGGLPNPDYQVAITSKSGQSLTLNGNTAVYIAKEPSDGFDKEDFLILTISDNEGQTLVIPSEPFVIQGKHGMVTCDIRLNKTAAKYGEALRAEWTITGAQPDKVSASLAGTQYSDIQGNVLDFVMTGVDDRYVTNDLHQLYLHLHYGDTTLRFQSPPIQLIQSPDVSPLTASLKFDSKRKSLGDTFQGYIEASGGLPPYTFECSFWTNGESGHPLLAAWEVEGNILFVTPFFHLPHEVSLSITDQEGRRVWLADYLQVDAVDEAKQLNVNIALDQPYAITNKDVTATWRIEGGTPPYEVVSARVYLRSSGLGDDEIYDVAAVNGNQAVFRLPEGCYIAEFNLIIKDSKGLIAGNVARIDEYTQWLGGRAQKYLDTKVSLDKEQVEINQPITATCVSTPVDYIDPEITYQYTWVMIQADGTERFYPDQNSGINQLTSTFTPTENGHGYLIVKTIHHVEWYDELEETTILSKPFTAGTVPAPVMKGDASGDGELTSDDLLSVIYHIIDGTPVANTPGGDTDGNGKINLFDLMYIVSQLAR